MTDRLTTRPHPEPARPARTYPASFGQQRLWFLDRLIPGASWYNIPCVYRLRGRLDVASLERAMTDVIARHEALRTTYREHDDGLVQVVAPAASFTIPVRDLSGLPPAAREAPIRDAITADMHEPLDLVTGPVVRMTLLRIAADDHYLLFCVHHISFDGDSMAICFEELRVAYGAHLAGVPVPLPPPALQYADYARWQREHVDSPAFARQLDYWRRQLAGLPDQLNLPADRTRPAAPKAASGTEFTDIPAGLTARLEELGRAESGTLFMVLLTALQVLLSRYSGQSDICVGIPVAGRTRREWQRLIGFFVNALPMRVDLSGKPSFRDALRRVRDVLLDALMNQEVPYEHIVRELGPARKVAHAPLFQVMLAMQQAAGADGAPLDLPGLTSESIELSFDTTNFDLTLTVAKEQDGGLGAMLRYSVDLFDARTARNLMRHLQNVLASAAADPDQPVTSIDLLSPEERHQVLTEWNGASQPVPRQPLPALFEAQAARTPHATAVVDRDVSQTYAELNAQANQLAHHLIGLGVGPEDVVAVAVPPSTEMVGAVLAVLKAGAAYLPIDPDHPAGLITNLLADARPSCLVTMASVASRLPADGVRRLTLDAADLAPALDRCPATDPSDADRIGPLRMSHPAYVIYTSGSTGQPKGVVVQHDALANYLAWTADQYPYARGTALLHSPLSFDHTVTALYTPLITGGCVVLARLTGANPSTPADLANRTVTFLKATPSHLPLLTALPEAFSPTGDLLLGGEALTGQALSTWRSRHPAVTVRNMYGPTETTVNCTEYLIEPGAAVPDGVVPIGRPQGNIRCYLLDPALQLVPTGVVGELYVSGAGVARGYLNRPGLTAERFVPDPYGPPGSRMYRTGDLVRRQLGGDLVFLARADRQVKVRGVRIEPGEIEMALTKHPAVSGCAVTVHAAVPGDERIVAYVVLTAPGAATQAVLRDHLARLLPAAAVPAAYVLLDRLPLTRNGKVDRAALPVPDQVEAAVDGPVTAPRTPVERALAEIWSTVLRTSRFGVHDDFFAIGGHSFSALWLTTLTAERLSDRLALADVFRRPTIAGQAELLARSAGTGPRVAASPVVPLAEKRHDRPSLFLFHSVWGNPAEYRSLAEQLAEDYRVYGLMAPGLEPGTRPLRRIEDLVRHYIYALDAAGHEEPYRVGGFSFGGIIALEAALQLVELGRDVETLILFDSRVASFDGEGRPTDEDVAAWTPADTDPCHDARPEDAERMVRVARSSMGALGSYLPMRRYPGRVVVVLAEEGPEDSYGPTLGWERWVAGHLTLRSMPGDHYSMLSPSHASRLAAEVRAGLALSGEGS